MNKVNSDLFFGSVQSCQKINKSEGCQFSPWSLHLGQDGQPLVAPDGRWASYASSTVTSVAWERIKNALKVQIIQHSYFLLTDNITLSRFL